MAAIPETVTTAVLSLGYKSQRRNCRQGGEREQKEGEAEQRGDETGRRRR
jgi:hypothetical protein